MTDNIQEIRQQLHELRNAMAPVDFRFANIEHEIEKCRFFFQKKTGELEAKVLAQSLKLEEQGAKIDSILERLQRIELALNLPTKPVPGESLPVNGEIQRSPNRASGA